MKKEPAAPNVSTEWLRNPRRVLRAALIVAAYLFVFLISDVITKQFEELPGIVAWYPPAALNYTLLLVFGVRFAPAVTIALFISNLFIYRMPQPPYVLFLWAIFISLVYSGAAAFLRNRIRIDWRLRKLRDVTWFVFTTVLVSALLAVLSVLGSALSSDLPRSEVLSAIFHWWIGETVGVLTVTPFLLIFVMPGLKRFAEGQPVRMPAHGSFPHLQLSTIGQVASLAFVLYWVLGAPALHDYQPLYLISLPLIWIALQRGFKGVSAAIVVLNSGVVLALWFSRFDLARLDELQLVMILNCIVSLLMGAVVTERKQAEEVLRENERELKTAQSLGRLGSWSFDCESQVITWSEQVYHLYERDPVLGPPTPEQEAAYYSPEQAQIQREYRTCAIKEGKSIDYDLEVNLSPRKHLFFSAKLQPVKDPNGRVVSLLGTIQDVTERKRTETERQALLEILQGMSTIESLPDLLELIRQSLAKVLYAENFFVVFRNRKTGLFEEVFAVDKYDPAMPPSKLERSITSYVFRTGEPLLLTQAKFEELVARGDVELVGTMPAIWLGVPLKTTGETIGVIAIQNYEDPDCYSERDKDFLASVAMQVTLAIVRKQAEQEIVSLARFPSETPNPVLRLSQDGIVMYANLASGALLNMWGCTVDGSTPQFWRDLVIQVLANRENKTVDIECAGKVYSMVVIPVAEMGYVDLYGRDITERKQWEDEIRSRTEELSTLYQLSRALADANGLENLIELVTRQAMESVRTTFAFILLLEDGDLVSQPIYPIRNLGHDFNIGDRQPLTALPICQRVLEKNEPVILQAGNPEVGNTERAALLLDFAQTACLVPLRVGDPSQFLSQPLGLLILGEARQEKREPFTPEKIRLARSIGDQAAAAILRMLLRQETERRLQHLSALSEIDRAITSGFDLNITIETILAQVIKQLHVDAANVLLLNSSSQTLEFFCGQGFRTKAVEGAQLRLGESHAGRAALERIFVHISNLQDPSNDFLRNHLADENFVSYYGAPLITKGQVKGVLEIFHRTPLEPNKEWLDFLNTLTGQAAIAIDVVQLFDSLQRSNIELGQAYDATIEGWSHALDLRDKETEGHTLRVAEMTVNLARALGLSEDELVQVRWGGLLHDIGKMGVPDSILLKPGPLTDEEWVMMKKHPDLAFEMLSPIRYLRTALDIPYCHHEKWDGTGYPRGLKGEQIPLTARIFAVVDVWDALNSDRPYRKAWSKEKARQHIQAGAGTHFDPQVVKIFFLEQSSQ